MYNHMVGRTASVISPFYSLLPVSNTKVLTAKLLFFVCILDYLKEQILEQYMSFIQDLGVFRSK